MRNFCLNVKLDNALYERAVFFSSFAGIAQKLLLSSISTLKTWYLITYMVIPFALLGYGIGAMLVYIYRNRLSSVDGKWIIYLTFTILVPVLAISSLLISVYHITMEDFTALIETVSFMLFLKVFLFFVLLIVPFIIIGFILTYVFSYTNQEFHRLYFIDLIGAGFASVFFFFVISYGNIGIAISLLCLIVSMTFIGRWRITTVGWTGIAISIIFSFQILYQDWDLFTVDRSKGFEYFPGILHDTQYDRLVSQWHSFGRTELFHVKDSKIRNGIANKFPATFSNGLGEKLDYSYFTTNYLAGTPVFQLNSILNPSPVIPQSLKHASREPALVAETNWRIVDGEGDISGPLDDGSQRFQPSYKEGSQLVKVSQNYSFSLGNQGIIHHSILLKKTDHNEHSKVNVRLELPHPPFQSFTTTIDTTRINLLNTTAIHAEVTLEGNNWIRVDHIIPTREVDSTINTLIFNADGNRKSLIYRDSIVSLKIQSAVTFEDLSKQNRNASILEAPYQLLERPSVGIIGVGGGRDILHALLNDARDVVGAEVNPVTYKAMTHGGIAHNYSGGIYTHKNVKIHNVDGRYLFNNTQPESLQLIILNGADTYAAISSGANSFAESYIYTRNALDSYFEALSDDGMVQFVRWFFPDMPRESLRLLNIITESLSLSGAKEPLTHLGLWSWKGWSITLARKTPFSSESFKILDDYMRSKGAELLFNPMLNYQDNSSCQDQSNKFETFACAYVQGDKELFEDQYPFDIQVVTDDKPFFYHYYKLSSLFKREQHSGGVHIDRSRTLFLIQLLSLGFSVVMAFTFILLPLIFSFRQKMEKTSLSNGLVLFSMSYFTLLGLAFMFIEISLIEKFVLVLESPVNSIAVSLTSLLISAGLGSLLIPKWYGISVKRFPLIAGWLVGLICSYMVAIYYFDEALLSLMFSYSFTPRLFIVAGVISIMGFLLGAFLPMGLTFLRESDDTLIPLAWGINAIFSVVGASLAIIAGQFLGFSLVMGIGTCLYFLIWLVGSNMIKIKLHTM